MRIAKQYCGQTMQRGYYIRDVTKNKNIEGSYTFELLYSNSDLPTQPRLLQQVRALSLRARQRINFTGRVMNIQYVYHLINAIRQTQKEDDVEIYQPEFNKDSLIWRKVHEGDPLETIMRNVRNQRKRHDKNFAGIIIENSEGLNEVCSCTYTRPKWKCVAGQPAVLELRPLPSRPF